MGRSGPRTRTADPGIPRRHYAGQGMSEPDSPPPQAAAGLAERILGSLTGLTSFVRRRLGPDLAGRESASDIVPSTSRQLLRGGAQFEDQGDASFQRWIQGAAEHKLQNRARYWRAQRREGSARPIGGGGGGADGEDPAAEPAAP